MQVIPWDFVGLGSHDRREYLAAAVMRETQKLAFGDSLRIDPGRRALIGARPATWDRGDLHHVAYSALVFLFLLADRTCNTCSRFAFAAAIRSRWVEPLAGARRRPFYRRQGQTSADRRHWQKACWLRFPLVRL